MKTITSHPIKIITIMYLSSVDTVYKRYSYRDTLGSSFGFKISDIVPWSALWAYGMHVLATDTFLLALIAYILVLKDDINVHIYHIQYIPCKKVAV